ncbi:MAG: GNAT family N-acetyltransferase [Anaerolineales bacterium]
MLELRQATESDAADIRALIRQVGINPLDLDWRRFIVAVSPQGQLIGCGQVKPHRDGSYELASIAVNPGWRNQGVARATIERLISEQPDELYLTCRAELGPFYEKFGFRTVEAGEMPPYFKRLSRLIKAFNILNLMGEGLLVMKKRNREAE